MRSTPAMDDLVLDALTTEQQEELAQILDGYLADLERGLPPSQEQLIARYPHLAEPLQTYLRSLDFVHRNTAKPVQELPSDKRPARSMEQMLGDYRLVREIGRGGMGIVYEAEQLSLSRRVALKILPFAAVMGQKQIARFNNEARAAAQLHHPHIVPVFAVGCERGVHYYAMQFIEGHSLDFAIRELRRRLESTDDAIVSPQSLPVEPPSTRALVSTLHAISTTRSIARRDYIRAAAELAIQAAEALQHAHDCGVVHRDVKPSNLMLDRAGKLWVTDFGLARVQTDAGLTLSGDVVGTIRYMSPEQAAGQSVDARTDVFSLGVTLYELLTLKPAFDVPDRPQTPRLLEAKEPVASRRLNSAIPTDLETILLKTIATSREDRYASAGELADDLRAFLAGATIRARRPTLIDRAAKWAIRHRGMVAAGIGVCSLLLLGLAVSTAMIAQAQWETHQAWRQAQNDFERAEKYFAQTRQVVDRLGVRVAERLAFLPGSEPIRREILQETLTHHLSFVRYAQYDPKLLEDVAFTYAKIGETADLLGDVQASAAAYSTAVQRFQQLAAQRASSSSSDRYREQQGLCLNNLGLLLCQNGDVERALQAFQSALPIQEELCRRAPRDSVGDQQSVRADRLANLAVTHSNKGMTLGESGRSTEAESSFREAIRSLKDALSLAPDGRRQLNLLASCYNNLGHLRSRSSPLEALALLQQALEMQDKRCAAAPDDFKSQSDRALTCNNLGAVELQLGRAGEASVSYSRAVDIQGSLSRKAPAVVRYRADLAVSLNNLGQVLNSQRHQNSAEFAFMRAKTLFVELSRDYPNTVAYRAGLGGVLNNLAIIHEERKHFSQATEEYELAIEHVQHAVENAPAIAEYRNFLQQAMANYDRCRRLQGDANGAVQAVQPDGVPLEQNADSTNSTPRVTGAEQGSNRSSDSAATRFAS